MGVLDIITSMADKNSIANSGIDVLTIFNKPFNLVVNNSLMDGILSVTSTIGMLFMLIYFLIHLEDLVIKQQFTLGHIVVDFSKLIVGFIVVSNIGKILVGFDTFVQGIVTDLGIPTTLQMTPDFQEAHNAARRMSILEHQTSISENIDMGGAIALAWVFAIILHFVLWSVAIKRALELGVYYALAPIIFADLFSSGISGVAARLKRALAIYMQLPFVLIAVSLGRVLMVASVETQITASSVYVICLILIAINKTVAGSKTELERIFSS